VTADDRLSDTLFRDQVPSACPDIEEPVCLVRSSRPDGDCAVVGGLTDRFCNGGAYDFRWAGVDHR
jgi:hypothetical protein